MDAALSMLRHAAGAGLDAAHLRVRPARIAARRIIKQVAFFSWYAAQACILFGACLFASSLAYGLAYWLWIPRPLHTFPVYFVYGNGGSAAELFGAPLLSRQSHPDASNTLPEAFIDLRDDGRATWQRSVYAESTSRHLLPVLAPRNEYAFHLRLVFPDVDVNWSSGMFMVHVDLLTPAVPTAVGQARALHQLLSRDTAWAQLGVSAPVAEVITSASRAKVRGVVNGPGDADDDRVSAPLVRPKIDAANRQEGPASGTSAPATSDCSDPLSIETALDAETCEASASRITHSISGSRASPEQPADSLEWRDELVAVPDGPEAHRTEAARTQAGGARASASETRRAAADGHISAIDDLLEESAAALATRSAADATAARIVSVTPAALAATRLQPGLDPGRFTVLARCSRAALLRPPQAPVIAQTGGSWGLWGLATWPWHAAWGALRGCRDTVLLVWERVFAPQTLPLQHSMLSFSSTDVRVDMDCFEGFVESASHPTAAVRVTLSSAAVQAPAPGLLEVSARLHWPVHAMYHAPLVTAAAAIFALACLCAVCGGMPGCIVLHAAVTRWLLPPASGTAAARGWSVLGCHVGWGVPLPPAWVDGVVDTWLPPPPPLEAPPPASTSSGIGRWGAPAADQESHWGSGTAYSGGVGTRTSFAQGSRSGQPGARMRPYSPGEWNGGGDFRRSSAAPSRLSVQAGEQPPPPAAPLSLRSHRRQQAPTAPHDVDDGASALPDEKEGRAIAVPASEATPAVVAVVQAATLVSDADGTSLRREASAADVTDAEIPERLRDN